MMQYKLYILSTYNIWL